MEIKNPEKIDLSDNLIIVIWSKEEKSPDYDTVHGVKIYHDGEYNDPITLADILERYPKTELVIAEDALTGVVYRYGNHGEAWEQVGKTIGYA